MFGLRELTGRRSAQQTAPRQVMDRLMIGCALVLVAWVTVLDTIIDNATGYLLADALSLYYPLSDVVLVTVVVLTIAQLRGDLLRWGLLGAGVLLMALTDHVFAYELALGGYRGGSSFAWGWWFAFALIGARPCCRTRHARRARPARPGSRSGPGWCPTSR